MSYKEVLSGRSIAISISDSPDMPAFGLSDAHLQDAMGEVARHLLALGARLVYGGDLRQHGFTKLLFELVTRHSRDASAGDGLAAVTNLLAWPVHIQETAAALRSSIDDLSDTAAIECLRLDGTATPWSERAAAAPRQPTPEEWRIGLTRMRQAISRRTDARVVLGGRLEKYLGSMPGIAEEAQIALQAGQPLYLLGGFGGAARDIAETMGLLGTWSGSRGTWPGRDAFGHYTAADLHNGLSDKENAILARTPHIDQAVMLILRGLVRLHRSP